MWWLLVLAAVAKGAVVEDLPPSCSRPVYCDSELLHHVQLQRIFNDSKTFVDLQMRYDQNTTLAAFDDLLNETNKNPTKEQIKSFVDKYFDSTSELEDWTPKDYTDDPSFLAGIQDEKLKQFGKDINAIWPILGRKVKPEVFEKPEQYSLVPVSHGFIIPGGRFKELYYWDTYWIIEGLLISGMHETAKGVIENLIELLKIFGHIPNGSRWYYQERSQPPLLSAMMSLYIRETKDIKFLRANIGVLEDELRYWLDTQIVTFDKDDQSYTLLRYFSPSLGPRPESYYEDYTDAQQFDTEERRTEFYNDLKSAAESGWDFSSRWFIENNGENTGGLNKIHTRDLIPVDLNAIFTNALQNMAYFRAILRQPLHAAHWAFVAKQWKNSIEKVLWHEEDGIWYDYDMSHNQHRRYFYPSNVSPLWMGAVDKSLVKKHAPRVISYLRNSQGLDYPGGIPASLVNTGEQWDLPNAWPPLVSMVVNALEALDTDESKELAFQVAQTWVRACYKGFTESGQMFEKYDVETPGKFGGGGEYNVQFGFGWSNGVVLEFLTKYGKQLAAEDSLNSEESSTTNKKSKTSETQAQEYKSEHN
ncbi:trehalase [Aphomia sociella]